MLAFQPYKSHGSSVLLSIDHTHSLIEQLEHTEIQLATMLMSKYIQPLREEAAQWAAKLASVSDILQKVSSYLGSDISQLFLRMKSVLNFDNYREMHRYFCKFSLQLLYTEILVDACTDILSCRGFVLVD